MSDFEIRRVIESNIPKIVCLCGSTRFIEAFHEANYRESLAGNIVLTVEIAKYDVTNDPQKIDPARKEMLDNLHLRKIDLADEVLILDVGGYIGESTRREIDYARELGKHIRWLEGPELHGEYRSPSNHRSVEV